MSFRLVIPILLLLLSGCGDGRVAIRGSVAVNGTPIKDGAINFRPIDVKSPGAATAIINGTYSITANRGVVPGEYLVQILASEDTGKVEIIGGVPTKIYRELVPAKYHAKSELKVNITRGKPCDFDLVVEEKDFAEGAVRLPGGR